MSPGAGLRITTDAGLFTAEAGAGGRGRSMPDIIRSGRRHTFPSSASAAEAGASDVGFGFGGFGSIGWLPIGPGDRFYPWYGRGVNRVNVVNVYNIHNNCGGFAPLREGPRAFSNLNRAFTDEHVRAGVSSMSSNQFGRGRVPMQQQRFDAGSFRQASVMTGSLPVTPSRESFRPSDRQVSPGAIPNRASANQRFFSSSGRTGTPQAARSQGGFNRGGNPGCRPCKRPGHLRETLRPSGPLLRLHRNRPHRLSPRDLAGAHSIRRLGQSQPNGGARNLRGDRP